MGDSILSQAEIDALLNGDSEVKDEPTASVSGESDIRPYDPNTQRRVVRERLQALEIINGRFARHFRMGLFNLLQHGPFGVLAGHPNAAQFIAAAIATIYSWIANRLWTYRGRTRDNATREAILFFFANACGIGISQFCLLFTHHILGLTSALADNIAVYVVGFALGTAFRFFFYHYVVFTGGTRA